MADPKQGGDLFDMAKDGTKVPGDAGKQNVIPSVANPHQQDSSTGGGLGTRDLQQAADNSAGGPHGPGIGEAVSGTGNALPQSIGEKHSSTGGK
ncbi:hypothetical protein DHEL01_v210784 [Diaporthe helianthi]|uniref:Uncharacterized protein n=1 Tax=Diaporthe helianthi TaxID=158607 RepID=A0A2P5HKP3_DIAHE|nr:hypothetical protein DHEL01_v210784 [Diaporthe helianthi]